MWSGMVAYGHSCNNQEAEAGGSQKVGGQLSSVQTNKTKKQTKKHGGVQEKKTTTKGQVWLYIFNSSTWQTETGRSM